MKVAYLAPELPALSATFVYNEILQLEKAGTRIVPFSVHRPSGYIDDPEVRRLSARVTYLYERSKLSVISSHLRLIKRLPKQYFSTIWLLLTDMFQLSAQRKLRTAFGLAYRFFYAVSLADELLKHRCSHLHVHFAHIPTDLAMYACHLSTISFSVTAHANDLFERGWLLRQKVSRSRFFATISEFNQHFLSEQGVDLSKVEIIRCGVDYSQFFPRERHVNSNPTKLGLVGRLVEKKGVDVLLRAMALLRQQGQNVQLSIAGSGPLMPELKELVFDLGLDGNGVVFLGSIPHKEVAEFVESLDIFVLPCKRDNRGDMDGIPVVLMEAMLSGVPVISSQISGIPELVIDGETGRCIEPDNPQALAVAVVDMISDMNKTQLMSQAAEELVREQFSLSDNVAKLDSLFRRSVSC